MDTEAFHPADQATRGPDLWELLPRVVKRASGGPPRGVNLTDAEKVLWALGSRLREIIDLIPHMVFISDREGRFLLVNRAVAEAHGTTVERLIGSKGSGCRLRPRKVASPLKGQPEVVEGNKPKLISEEKFVDIDGNLRHLQTTRIPYQSSAASGEVVLGLAIDITEQKMAEAALRESEAKHRNLVEQSNDAIYLLFQGKFEVVNRRFMELFGISAEEAQAPGFCFMELVSPKSRRLIEERIRMLERGEKPPPRYEFVALTRDGVEIEVEASVSYIPYRSGVATQGIIRDISQRTRLEEQLRHAIKMEAIGRLSSGVAHDFNNLLTAITSYAEMISASSAVAEPVRGYVDEIQRAAGRAAELTHQLLALSRKQKLEPKVLDLNNIIIELERMLQRIIGEDIELMTVVRPELWRVRVDPGRMEQVIMNMVANARDAMPQGGKLTIETANMVLDEKYCDSHAEVIPGRYAMLAISDTGCGMSHEVRACIFDPFFTTKGEGKGTGLGLSTVYGIIRQSGGHIWVYSELGKGTSFKIYLPAASGDDSLPSPGAEPTQGETPAPRGTETVLVVEDEESVRQLACQILKEHGYQVLEARSGDDAYLMCQHRAEPVDLVVTDLIMPNMSGSSLAKLIQEMWGGVKVLYMSGYTAESISHNGVLDSRESFLQKPFGPITLAHKVRQLLDDL